MDPNGGMIWSTQLEGAFKQDSPNVILQARADVRQRSISSFPPCFVELAFRISNPFMEEIDSLYAIPGSTSGIHTRPNWLSSKEIDAHARECLCHGNELMLPHNCHNWGCIEDKVLKHSCKVDPLTI